MGVGVEVCVDVGVDVGVTVGVCVLVGVAVGVGVAAAVGVSVDVNVDVLVGRGLIVAAAVGDTVAVACRALWPLPQPTIKTHSKHRAPPARMCEYRLRVMSARQGPIVIGRITICD